MTLEEILNYYRDLLHDFHIYMRPEIQHHIIELYPNEIAIENYIHTVIVDYLEGK